MGGEIVIKKILKHVGIIAVFSAWTYLLLIAKAIMWESWVDQVLYTVVIGATWILYVGYLAVDSGKI